MEYDSDKHERRRLYQKSYRDKHRASILEAYNKYRKKHRDCALADYKKYRKMHREANKKYRKKHRARVRVLEAARDKKYYKRNRERILMVHKKYRENNPGVIRKLSRSYRDKNRERSKELRKRLGPVYVRMLLARRSELQSKDIPDELVEVKTLQIKLLRMTRRPHENDEPDQRYPLRGNRQSEIKENDSSGS